MSLDDRLAHHEAGRVQALARMRDRRAGAIEAARVNLRAAVADARRECAAALRMACREYARDVRESEHWHAERVRAAVAEHEARAAGVPDVIEVGETPWPHLHRPGLYGRHPVGWFPLPIDEARIGDVLPSYVADLMLSEGLARPVAACPLRWALA
jgi:hypothetical protein